MSTKRLTTLAMLIAMNCVLCFAAPVKLDHFKFTFEAFPILVAGFLLGPTDGFIVGAVGSFIYQLLSYGLMLTTILWIIPHALSGLLVGLLARKKELNFTRVATISVISAISVTIMNTIALYLDSKINGYYSYAMVFGSLIYKFISGIILSVLFSTIMPKLIDRLKKIVR